MIHRQPRKLSAYVIIFFFTGTQKNRHYLMWLKIQAEMKRPISKHMPKISKTSIQDMGVTCCNL